MCPTSLPPASFLTCSYIPNPPLCSPPCPIFSFCCPYHTSTPYPPPFFFIPPSASLSSSVPQATPLLQSHPAFRDKENTEDQFCSVTFGGGLQSKGMAGETELREIYWGCLREREEISLPANSQEGRRGESKKREEKGREEKRGEEKRREEKFSVSSEIETDA